MDFYFRPKEAGMGFQTLSDSTIPKYESTTCPSSLGTEEGVKKINTTTLVQSNAQPPACFWQPPFLKIR